MIGKEWREGGQGEGGQGRFFPIKQPAEFVFSPKRRCRFKVIDCHPRGGHGYGWQEGEGGGGGGLSRGMRARTFHGIWGADRYERVLSLVSFRFVSPRPRFGTLRYVCSAVHLLAQYRGGIIITGGRAARRLRGQREGPGPGPAGWQSGFNDYD